MLNGGFEKRRCLEKDDFNRLELSIRYVLIERERPQFQYILGLIS